MFESKPLFGKSTKDHILKTSLELFNTRGFGFATTASIAEAAEVLQGTLWYHFNAKEDILQVHLQCFQDAFETTNQGSKSQDPNEVIAAIFRAYALIWDFRYLLRDDFRHQVEDCSAIKAMNASVDDWTAERMAHAQHLNLIQMNSSELEDKSEIILLIGRYWLDFSAKKYPHHPQALLRLKGLRHIINVIEPYLSDSARSILTSQMAEAALSVSE